MRAAQAPATWTRRGGTPAGFLFGGFRPVAGSSRITATLFRKWLHRAFGILQKFFRKPAAASQAGVFSPALAMPTTGILPLRHHTIARSPAQDSFDWPGRRRWTDSPAQVERDTPRRVTRQFRNPTELGNMARADKTLCRDIAQGGDFSVGSEHFHIAWDIGYARFEVICAGNSRSADLVWSEGRPRPISKLKKDIAARLDAGALRDAMTCRIDGERLRRGDIDSTTRDAVREHPLISIEGADKSLRFARQPDPLGQPSWAPIDTNAPSIFHRFRVILQRLFCPWILHAAKAEQDTWQRQLNLNLSCDQVRTQAHDGGTIETDARAALQLLRAAVSVMRDRHAGVAQRETILVDPIPVREALWGDSMAARIFLPMALVPRLTLPPVEHRDPAATSAQQQARQEIGRRWPTLVARTPLAVQVLLWHPDLALAEAQELAAAWDSLLLPDSGADGIELDEQPVAANSFTDLLARLGESAEFKKAHECVVSGREPTVDDRHNMGRVQATLRAIREDAAIRQLCFVIADEGLHRCGDRVALCFSTIEAECLVHGLRCKDHGAGLKEQLRSRVDLAVRMFRQAKFDELSAPYLLHLPAYEDAIEYRLILQQRCQQYGVIFPVAMGPIRNYVDVPDLAVANVVEGIRAAERNIDALVTYVAGLGFWQRFMEQYDPRKFDAACVDLEEDLRALGAHDMRRAGMDDDMGPDDHAAMAARDVNYFYRRYPEIANLASPPELTDEQFRLMRSQIATSRSEKVREVCRQLTAEVLLAQGS